MKYILIFLFILIQFNLLSQSKSYEKRTCNEDSIFRIADQMPEYPGGEIALRKYIYSHIKYPEMPVEEVNIGKTYVEFCVNKTGGVEHVKVIRSVHPLLDREAIKVVRSLPNWKPGKIKGKTVCVYYTIPISVQWKK